MTTDRWMRASDQDRERAVELLSEAYAVGRLSREELEERSDAAWAARTWGELRNLTGDLPGPMAGAGLPGVVASHGTPQRASGGRIGQLVWALVVVLAASPAWLVTPAVVWVTAILVPLVLLPFALRGRPPWV